MNETQSIGPTITPAPLSLLDALAVLACTQVRGKRNQVELKRRAQGVVDEAAERWVGRSADVMENS